MKLNVIYLSMNKDCAKTGYYDHGFLNHYLFPKFDCDYYEVEEIPEDLSHGVVVIPARMQADIVDKLNKELAKLEYVLAILTGDEESSFPWRELLHPRMQVWVMSPKVGEHDDAAGRIGSGYREETPKILKEVGLQDRILDWFFAGQVTHPVREQCVMQLRKMPNGRLVETNGFGKGLGYREYLENMARAKFVPCPSGPCTPDNFRLYEALESGCVPIADGGNYWPSLFGEEVPFPIISSWDILPDLMPQLLNDWLETSNKVFAWWQLYKRRLADKFENQWVALGGQAPTYKAPSTITAMIPAAPIPTNPSSEVIDETIGSIRERLPNAEIIVMFDACQDQRQEMKLDYEEFKRRMLWKMEHESENLIPIMFTQHSHQSLMLKEALKYIKTPLLLWSEQDTPLHDEIPFEEISEVVLAGYANSVRFHHEAAIPTDHEYLMLDSKPIKILGVPLIRNRQWSGRPQLVSTKFYKYIADKYLDDRPRFIEHVMYGIVVHGEYDEFRLHLYAPEGTLVRSLHLDGRRRGATIYDPNPS